MACFFIGYKENMNTLSLGAPLQSTRVEKTLGRVESALKELGNLQGHGFGLPDPTFEGSASALKAR